MLRQLSLPFLALSWAASAAPVNLAWDPVQDSRLTGYELGWGSTPGGYSQYQPAAGTAHTINLSDPGPWHIAVRALGDESGALIQSDWSNEVVWQAAASDPTQPLLQIGLWAKRAPVQSGGMVQYVSGSLIGSDPASVMLSAAPTQGNLLLVIVSERSGAPHANTVMAGSGWTKHYGIDFKLSDLSDRFSVSIFSKIANAGESMEISADNGTENPKWISAMEFSGSGFVFHGAASNQNATPIKQDSLGTGSVPGYSGDALSVSWVAIKSEYGNVFTSLAFSTVGGAEVGPAGGSSSYTMLHGAGYASSAVTTDTAAWELGGELAPRAAAAGTVVFTLTGGGL